MARLITRRGALLGFLLAPALATRAAVAAPAPEAALADLERRHGGRLGVAALDLATGARIEHRAGERFAMSSTFKFLAAGFVLGRVDQGEDRLDRRIAFKRSDLVEYSPVTETHADRDGMTLAEVCDAAITLSDNTAGNLLLDILGGPPGFTARCRALGDTVTRLDRREPDLNEAAPGDLRDTTTPGAMLENLRRLVVANSLSPGLREQLIQWLVDNKIGDSRLRAGFPKGWRVGDKTGSGGHGGTNDVAVGWPPERAPLLVAAYFAESPAPQADRNAVLAEAARIISSAT